MQVLDSVGEAPEWLPYDRWKMYLPGDKLFDVGSSAEMTYLGLQGRKEYTLYIIPIIYSLIHYLMQIGKSEHMMPWQYPCNVVKPLNRICLLKSHPYGFQKQGAPT